MHRRNLIGELFHRNVPQVLLGYIGLCWVAVEFTDFATERYTLTSNLVELVGLGLLSLLPAVLLVVWFYGAPGKDPRVPWVTYGVPLNLLGSMVLIYLVFSGVQSTATSEQVLVTNLETGKSEAREVPMASLRRRIGVYFLDQADATQDPELAWLQYGFTLMLSADLEQDMRIAIESPFRSANDELLNGLRQAGYDNGLSAPLALQGSIARKLGLDYFVRGSFVNNGQATEVELALYSVDPIINVANIKSASDDVLGLVDQLSEQIKSGLEVGGERVSLADDLPAASHLTESVPALKAFVEAKMKLLLHNDFDGALENFESALELDPTFALAWVYYGITQAENTNFDGARKSIARALQHGYRLTERQVYNARGLKHFLDGEIEERIQVYQLWVELYPNDVNAYVKLAGAYIWSGNQLEKAKETYRRILDIDAGADWVLTRIARLEASQSRYDVALKLYREYSQRHPSDSGTLINIGNMHERLGKFELAEAAYDRATLIDADAVPPILALAALFERKGDMRAAGEHYAEAIELAKDPRHAMWATYSHMQSMRRQGRVRDAYELYQTLEVQAQQVLDPMTYVLDVQYMNIDLFTNVMGSEAALSRIASLGAGLGPPWDEMTSLGYLIAHLEAGQPDLARPQLERLRQLIQSLGREDLAYMIENALGLIAELDGNYETAASHFEAALERLKRSVQNSNGPEMLAEIEVSLGRVLMAAGQFKPAGLALERALASIPAHAEGNLRLAQLRLHTGDIEGAEEHLRGTQHVLEQADKDFALAIEAQALARALAADGNPVAPFGELPQPTAVSL